MASIPWCWRSCVVAPTGQVMEWTIANSHSEAVRLAFRRVEWWPYAMMQGYRIRWVKEDRDE